MVFATIGVSRRAKRSGGGVLAISEISGLPDALGTSLRILQLARSSKHLMDRLVRAGWIGTLPGSFTKRGSGVDHTVEDWHRHTIGVAMQRGKARNQA